MEEDLQSYAAEVRAYTAQPVLTAGYPLLAGQWHPTRNGALTPEQVTAGSHRKVWWRCAAGHEWQAEVKSRANGSGCPYCANRSVQRLENDFATTHPMLAAQWDRELNGPLQPTDLVAGSHRRVWWRCQKGHVWKSPVAVRTGKGAGCPVCAGKVVVPGENDLATIFPAVAARWDWEKNESLTPEQVTPWSNRKVWWRCGKGHSYTAAVSTRTTKNSDCPYCTGRRVLTGFNDLETLHPAIAAQWHKELNGELTPQTVTSGSKKKVWWQCADGHVWKAVIYSRTGRRKCGCPVCAGKVKTRR